jgi:DinB superfamily
LSEKTESLKVFANLAFRRFDMTMKDLKESEIDWRPVDEANNIKWILTHLSLQWNIGFQRNLRGDSSYKPAGWPDDYVGSKSITYSRLTADLVNGKTAMLEGFGKLTAADLVMEVQSPRGPMKRYNMLMWQLMEIVHHEGQIAYIRGAIGRRRQKDNHFLV